MRNTVIAVIIICAALLWCPQDAVAEKIDDESASRIHALFAQVDLPGSPGAALAVARGGEIIYANGYGYANLEYDIPNTPWTIFHVASVSKQFTAFSVAMLAEQGKISLDDDIHTYIPELPDFGKKITLKHLVYHTSGIRDQWELLAIAGWRLDDVITMDHIMKMLTHQRELNFNPGDEHMYCNSGYTLLAEVVARVTGTSFREWTQKNIFEPLGMTNTHFHDDHEMIVKNRAYSYSKTDDGFAKSVLSYANVGATSLFTTAEDLTKWTRNFSEKKVGGPAVIEQMLERGVLNNGTELQYAFGLFIEDHRGQRTVGHSGGDAGFRSHVVMFPDQDLSVVVLSNFGSFDPSGTALKVADILLEDMLEPVEEEAAAQPVEVDPAVLERLAGTYAIESFPAFTFSAEDGKLWLEVTGQGKFELEPRSEMEYFLAIAQAKVVFTPDADGSVNNVTVGMGGRELTGRRIHPAALSDEQLSAYVGDYYSPELRTTYSIVVEDGGLVAKHQRHPDSKLVAAEPDKFSGTQWWFSNLAFQRDDRGDVTGFLLTGGRVRNLRFDRVD